MQANEDQSVKDENIFTLLRLSIDKLQAMSLAQQAHLCEDFDEARQWGELAQEIDAEAKLFKKNRDLI